MLFKDLTNEMISMRSNFKTVFDNEKFNISPTDTYILGWEDYKEDVSPEYFGLMAKSRNLMHYYATIFMIAENGQSAYLMVFDARNIKNGQKSFVYRFDITDFADENTFISQLQKIITQYYS